MSSKINVGDKINNWEILEIDKYQCFCRCLCGRNGSVTKFRILSGESKQCKYCNIKDKKLKLINQKFNKWTIIYHINNKMSRVRCECGNERDARITEITKGYTKGCPECWHKSCIVNLVNVTNSIFNKIIARAKKQGQDFAISREYINKLLELQNYRCNISGVEISFAKTLVLHSKGETTASLDRIDSSKGYIKGNVQWVHKDVNLMKNSFDENYYIDMCKKISKHNKQDLSSVNDDWYETSEVVVRKSRRMSYSEIMKVRKLHKLGKSNAVIADKMNISVSYVYLIVANKTRIYK